MRTLDNLDRNKVRKFTRKFQSEYQKRSYLSKLCEVSVYEEDSYPNVPEEAKLEYNKIGKWTQVPVDVLQNELSINANARQYARGMSIGERRYILDQFDTNVSRKKIESVRVEDVSYDSLKGWCSRMSSAPDNLILPSDEQYREQVLNWRESGNYQFGAEERVTVGPYSISIHWVPEEEDLNNGYLLDSRNVSVTTKWFGDDNTDTISEFDHEQEYDRFSLNRPLMIYVDKEIRSDEKKDYDLGVDLLYQIIVSELSISSGSLVKLNL